MRVERLSGSGSETRFSTHQPLPYTVLELEYFLSTSQSSVIIRAGFAA